MLQDREISLVLVDFDDTLVDTAPRFHTARLQLFGELVQHGFDEAEIYRIHHDEVDPEMRQRYGFGPQRLEHAFRATYEALCVAHGREPDETVAERAAGIGRQVAGPPRVLDGAMDALARLTAVFQTALYTQSGDVEYQMGCVTACGILDVIPVDRVVICDHKTGDRFRRTLDDFGIEDPATVWMIGNSMRHDINPALENGANAIFIEVADPWEFDVVPPVSESYHTVRSFPAAASLLLSIQER